MKLGLKLLSLLMFATLSFGVANFVYAANVVFDSNFGAADYTIVGDGGIIYTFTASENTLSAYAFQTPQMTGDNPSTIKIKDNVTNIETTIGQISQGDDVNTIHNLATNYITIIGRSYSFKNYGGANYYHVSGGTNVLRQLFYDDSYVPPVPLTATSTLTRLADPIINGGTSLANTVFQFIWPIILVLGIFYGFVILLRKWIASILIRSKNIDKWK